MALYGRAQPLHQLLPLAVHRDGHTPPICSACGHQAHRSVSPFEETAANQTERRIEAALASLPAMYREVLLLVGVEGLQPHEAAAICGVTPEALRQRLHRARTLLAERLDVSAQPAPARVGEVLP